MNAILSIIATVFGKFLYLIYNTVGFENYALSLLIFTVAVKLLLMPLSIKQIKGSQKMQEIQPEVQKLQERYKNDKQKLNEETMKLYQEKGYNPASGCLPILLQMPVLFALFFVIRMPMSYMFEIPMTTLGDLATKAIESKYEGFNIENIEKMAKVDFEAIKGDPKAVYDAIAKADYYYEIKIVDYIAKNPSVLENTHVKDAAGNEVLSDEKRAALQKYDITLFGVFNFGIQPTYDLKKLSAEPLKYIPALFLLIIAVITTYISTKYSMPKPDPKAPQPKGAGCTNNSMLLMGPGMTLMFGFSMPCGLAFYWIISNILSLAQTKYLNYLKAKAKGESARA